MKTCVAKWWILYYILYSIIITLIYLCKFLRLQRLGAGRFQRHNNAYIYNILFFKPLRVLQSFRIL